MKRAFSVIFVFAVTVLLCACGVKSVVESNLPAPTPAPTAAPTPTPAPTENPLDRDFENMLAGFNDIRAGSSGCSLRAVQQAVKLLDWGTATDMNIDEISSRTKAFLQSADESYSEQLNMLYGTYRDLLTDGKEDLLDSAGCQNTAYPWGGTPIAGIEAVFEAAGVV